MGSMVCLRSSNLAPRMSLEGHERRFHDLSGTSAYPPKLDIWDRQLRAKSGCEQSQQRSPLFDHLVGEREEIVGNLDTERLGGFEIDDKLELGR